MVSGDYVHWGFKDGTIFCPQLFVSEEALNQQFFNLMYHLKLSLSEVMAWSHTMRVDMWERYLAQLKYERDEREKALG